ncbi:hypothetical protein RchiOBHm_Chr6g0280721 [Rosa chinensis]|uniref:Uncharacterized protein n=1 Tax=Rosa chinensis TaxID=74649 RepID=A0A2P6PTE4_ROSCH|nr:hypothetical protein RchiOBHm_Chr6g0280721 [Rosa chinensis]
MVWVQQVTLMTSLYNIYSTPMSFCSDARSLYDVRSVFSEAPMKKSLSAKKRSEFGAEKPQVYHKHQQQPGFRFPNFRHQSSRRQNFTTQNSHRRKFLQKCNFTGKERKNTLGSNRYCTATSLELLVGPKPFNHRPKLNSLASSSW